MGKLYLHFFTPIQQLHPLTSLTVLTESGVTTINKLMDQIHFIFKQLPPEAPLRCIFVQVSSYIRDFMSHPTVEVLRSILKSRHGPPRVDWELKLGLHIVDSLRRGSSITSGKHHKHVPLMYIDICWCLL